MTEARRTLDVVSDEGDEECYGSRKRRKTEDSDAANDDVGFIAFGEESEEAHSPSVHSIHEQDETSESGEIDGTDSDRSRISRRSSGHVNGDRHLSDTEPELSVGSSLSPTINLNRQNSSHTTSDGAYESHGGSDKFKSELEAQGKNRQEIDPQAYKDDDDTSEDAMKLYADASQQEKTGFRHSPRRKVLHPISAQSLKEHRRRQKIKYFHYMSDATDIPEDIPDRCLVCGEAGHEMENCVALRCSHCDVQNSHPSRECPRITKCNKCRSSGHEEGDCTYKLKKIAEEECECELCGNMGHVESDCEALWRTSVRPWNIDYSEHQIRVFCYECGKKGHFGNDCPNRQPGKARGTSTWSLRKGTPTPSSVTGRSASNQLQKGAKSTAKRQHYGHDDHERFSDVDNFHRSKSMQQGAPKKVIRMNLGNDKSVETFKPSWNTSSRPGSALYSPSGADTSHSSFKQRSQQPDSRRERPPHNLGSHHVQSSAARIQTSYQPLPSAAQEAWSRYRR